MVPPSLFAAQAGCPPAHAYRFFISWGRTVKGVPRTFPDHAEHEPQQPFEGHFAFTAEILISFFRAVFISGFSRDAADQLKTIFFQ
jgi:hypothetical protein